MSAPAAKPLVVYFDGVCTLCNHAIDFLIRRDHREVMRFAPLQGETARARGLATTGDPDSIVVDDAGRLLERSDAALRLAAALGGAWRLTAVFRVVPRPLRDLGYRLVARYRYRLFGRRETCRLPTPSEKRRFLP